MNLFDIVSGAQGGNTVANLAKQFGLDEKYGTIEPGKVTNLLILDKNPRLKVSNWLTIDTIVLHGTAIKREDLAVNAH